MGYELKIAWQYFRSHRKGLARFTKTVAIIGIAAGVASLILAQALANGFESELREKILGNTAHIAVFRVDGAEIENWKEVRDKIAILPNIRWIDPTTYESAIVIGEKNTSYAVLRAVKGEGEDISLGNELAEKIGAGPGSEIEIIVPGMKEFAPMNSKAVVENTLKTGLYDYDSTWVYVSFDKMAKLSGKNEFVPTTLSVYLKDIYRGEKTAEQIRAALSPDFKVIEWQEANRPLFAALTLERKVVFAVISLIIFIAALSITTTLALLVNERRLDIAVLRTCGMQTKELVSLFVFEGLLLGLAGTISGIVAGLMLCLIANYFRLIDLPSEVYSISFVSLRPSFWEIVMISSSSMGISLLATLYPAWQASRIKPLENLRIS